MLVTILIVGWILLSVSGALRGVVAVVNERALQSTPHGELMAEMVATNPHLLEDDPEWAEQEKTQREERVLLEGSLAPVLLVAALLAFVGALMLLKRNPWCRVVLSMAGVLGLDVSIRHAIQVVGIQTAHAVYVPEAQGAIEALETLAAVNLAVMSVPLVLLVGLLFHPTVGRFLDTSTSADV